MQKSSLACYLGRRLKTGKFFTAALAVYAAFCLGSAIYFFTQGQVRNGVQSALFILIAPLAPVLEKYIRLRWPDVFIALLLLLPAGGILGTCYDLYTAVPCFDIILHTLSGFVFVCLGYGLMTRLTRDPDSKKTFAACLLFGIAFALAIAAVWELFEYLGTLVGGYDMHEDTIIDGFASYLLAGSHNEIVEVNGIVQTVIHYGDGQTLVIDGYLDIGLLDTLSDMFVCLLGTVAAALTVLAARCFCRPLFDRLVPAPEKAPPKPPPPTDGPSSSAALPTAA